MADAGLLPVAEALQTVFNGATLGVGYKVTTYQTGTSTKLSTYPTLADAQAATNANANPTIADSSGRVAMYGSGSTAYKVVVTTAADGAVKTIDPVYFIPGATVLQSKTPSEYQIVFCEDVSGSYKLTNAQTEDTYDFKYASTGITLGGAKKFFFRDANIYINSAADGYLDLTADTQIRLNADCLIGTTDKLYFRDTTIFINSGAATALDITAPVIRFNHPTADTNLLLQFIGTTNSGEIIWQEDEDLFQITDEVQLDSTEKLQFGSNSKYIYDDGTDLQITSNTDIYLDGTVKFGTHTALSGETVTGYITIEDSGGTTRKVAIVS